MFRLKNKNTGQWYKAIGEGIDIIWTWSKVEALVFPSDKREFWETQEDVEIVPLAEDELLSRLGQPRLEGF